MTAEDVRERLVAIGVAETWSPLPGTSLDSPLPRNLPSGKSIRKQADRERIDSWLWTYTACQNKGDWFTTGHETDNYLHKASPTATLQTFDEYVLRQEQDDDNCRPYIAIGGTFGWMTLEDGRIGVFYLDGIAGDFNGDQILLYPGVTLLILIEHDSSYLVDDFEVLGDVYLPA